MSRIIELIQIVRVYHNEDSCKKLYWFEVPKTQQVKCNQMVVANTKKGRKKVTATCDSFFIQKDAISVLGVSELKSIVGILEEREVIWDVE